ncbi:MAG TPA: DUF2142 domain-containing protein [Tepidisphaeraceae bacterium]
MGPNRLIPQRASKWFAPARAFVWVALLLGIPLAAVTAPFQAPDEPQHFLRAYQISEGGLLPIHIGPRGGAVLPVSLVDVPDRFQHLRFHTERKTSGRDIRAAMGVPLEPANRAFIPFVTAIYSPVGYVPQAIAIGIGRRFDLPPLALMYLARWANLLAWVAMGYVALRITPVCARPLFLLLLMPMSLFQAASMSADATTNGLAVLFAAAVMRIALSREERTVGALAWAGLTLISAALTLTKFAYLPISALALLIPAERFAGRSRRTIALALFFAANLAVILLWAPQTGGLDAVLREDGDANARAQVAYLRSHPTAAIRIATGEILADSWRMVRSCVGSRLGSKDVKLWGGFIDVYLVAMLLACWSPDEELSPPATGKLLLLILIPVAISIAGIALLNYLYWTPVGAGHIDGMQGRYLIPLAPGVLLLLWGLTRRLPKPPWNGVAPRKLDAIATSIALAGALYAVFAVYFRYYAG